MTCTSCGEKPKKCNCHSRDFPSAVVEINNPEQLVLLRKVLMPSSLPEADNPPVAGKYHNVILKYEDTGHLYIYSSDGIPTKIDATIPQEVLDRIATLEGDVDDLQLEMVNETAAREWTDNALQREIDDLKNSPDVVDIVATYADLMAYDTSTLGDKDVIRVLRDETHEGQSSYYRWSTSTQTWTFIGTVGDYYTKQQVNTLLDAKQDVLTAGDNITIEDESGALVISAADTTYTAGSNVQISPQNVISATDTTYTHFTGATASTDGVQGLVPGPLAGDEDKYLKGDGTWGTVQAGPTVVQATGTSTTDVMSQNAVTSMVFADPSTKQKVRIGSGATTSGSSANAVGWNSSAAGAKAVALGTAANASADGAIALGANSSATQQGEVAIGTSQTNMGYNSSNYRLLTGLYDGQNAHDAVTKGQMDTELSYKQDELTAGDGITIEDESGALVISSNVEGIITLTSADYDYPSGTPDGIALWALDEGFYHVDNGVNIYPNNSYSVATNPRDILVVKNESLGATYTAGIFVFVGDGINTYHTRQNGNPVANSGGTVLKTINVIDSLSNSSPIAPLSANQGRALKDMVDAKQDALTAGDGITIEDESGSLVISATSTGPTVVQTTGTSTTDVMSQNATTSMVYADPSTKQKVQVGGNSVANGALSVALGYQAEAMTFGNGNIAIGHSAQANNGAIAIGRGTQNTVAGTVSFQDTNWGTSGYNNTGYRLLTGLYDPQSAHDAATKGYVDTATSGKLDDFTTFWGQTASNGAVDGLLTVTNNGGLPTMVLGAGSIRIERANYFKLSALKTGSTYTDVLWWNSASSNVPSDVHIDAANAHLVLRDTGVLSLRNDANGPLTISGVKDPQSANDAATKGYVDTSVAAIGAGTRRATSSGWNTSSSLDYILQKSSSPSNVRGAMFYTGNNLSDFPVYAGIGIYSADTESEPRPYLLVQTTSDDGQGTTSGNPAAYKIALHSEIPATFTTNEWNALWA